MKEEFLETKCSGDEILSTEKVQEGNTTELDNIPADKVDTLHNCRIWVSNIPLNVRANDLKKCFNEYGKVLSAKILTNGKNFYGCVSMETCEQAENSVIALNKSLFEGKVIQVSKRRPDMKNLLENIPTKGNTEKKDEKNSSNTAETKKSGQREDNNKKLREKMTENSDRNKKLISELERRLKNANADLSRMKRKLDEYEKKNMLLERDSRKEMERIRSDRRRLNHDQENFEKTRKDFQKEMSIEKASIAKELDEARALRIKLQDRLDNFHTSVLRSKRKSRSPSSRNTRNTVDCVFSGDDRRQRDRSRDFENSKRPRRENPATSRLSAPTPPRLTEFDRCPQRNEYFVTTRSYYADEKKQESVPENVANVRQKFNFENPDRNRSSYPVTYPKDVSRNQSFHVQSFMNGRLSNQTQNTSQMLGPSRAGQNPFFNVYGKQYGQY